jgi:glutamate N-acetyltransferase/amino-acid N-acetyltransferase
VCLGGTTPRPPATLLSFLTTDAKLEKQLLQSELQRAADKSFNSVTVDGDTSTNDTAILLASGASGVEISEENLPQFRALLDAVCIFLAREVARDGEGATKIITIQIHGAQNESDAKKCAMTIANSPLVKTAIFGNDPNWGRIAAAAGRSGARFDAKNLDIKLSGVQVFCNGEPLDFDLPQAESILKKEEVLIEVSLGAGDANWTAWTCDFSYDYVKINAEYHT